MIKVKYVPVQSFTPSGNEIVVELTDAKNLGHFITQDLDFEESDGIPVYVAGDTAYCPIPGPVTFIYMWHYEEKQ